MGYKEPSTYQRFSLITAECVLALKAQSPVKYRRTILRLIANNNNNG